jgi:hypothetical protein
LVGSCFALICIITYAGMNALIWIITYPCVKVYLGANMTSRNQHQTGILWFLDKSHCLVLPLIAAGFGVRWSVPRTGFDEPETDSETPHDSVKIAADSCFRIVPGSSIWWRTVRQKFPFPKSYLLQS